jgi:hypothetical protein
VTVPLENYFNPRNLRFTKISEAASIMDTARMLACRDARRAPLARCAEFEAKQGKPPKTPDNSSLPPSRGQKDMGLVIASGLSIGTLFTLFVVPAVYLLIATDQSRTSVSDKELAPLVSDSELRTSATITATILARGVTA